MKTLRLFLLILLSVPSIHAQENGTLFLSKETLNKFVYSFVVEQPNIENAYPEWFSTRGWKYHPGDDLKWKETAFNDSNWILFRTDFSLDSVSKGEWQGIGWFRLKLVIDSSLYNQSLALVMQHFGASEIYLDGKLINQYGLPSYDPAIEKTFRPLNLQPVILSLDDKSEHLLAVRYSFLHAQELFNKYRNTIFLDRQVYAGFMMHFGNANEVIDYFGYSLKNNLLFALFSFIPLFLMGFFHTCLFLFYTRDRSNLYLAIYNFTVAGFCFADNLGSYTHLSWQAAMLNNFIDGQLWNYWLPASMLAYYSMFYRKLPKHVWLYCAGIILMVYSWIPNSNFQFTFWFSFHNWLLYIAILDMLRLFIKSILKKERNVWIIGIGVLLSQTSWILYLHPSLDWINQGVLAYSITLAMPVSLLIFNAIRTAGTSKNLEKQLVEVNRLSALSSAQEQEKRKILNSQKEQLEQKVQERTNELSKTLEDLKATQGQLIQSEKMASLGELTAGIAHEIQNPLNFVNNFSEVNSELSEEIIVALKKGNIGEAQKLAEDIRSNQEKVREHGQHADAIVKSMLEHSRSSSGQKEPTNINALADEYLRLAYHRMRAKDKSFNVAIKTEFYSSLGKINIIPQDIGRVLLNLYNNAFYAVGEKRKTAEESFVPSVSICTQITGNDEISQSPNRIPLLPAGAARYVLISVKDNGNGIPDKVREKIFQPFFTTKPTGSGIGLGLSLSYDIVKAHSGEIRVESWEGEGSEFIIQLPIG